MANIISSETLNCKCGKCPTYAKIIRWDCGCVQVEIYNDRNPCSTCTNFSAMRKHCGRSGSPTQGHR